MHTAKDLAAAREVQRGARLWAADQGLIVRGTHGAEEIETPDGSRWMIRGRDSVYSYSAGFGIVDEAWGVDPRFVDDGLEPLLVEREGGQLLLISTAHRRASSLFPERRRAAIRSIGSPGRSSLAEWSAPGDGDPLDILVLSEHHIPRGDIILKARPIGGFCLVDNHEADDKIIAVLKGDKVFEQYKEISQLPKGILERFEHYFLTYKSLPDEPNQCEIAYSYGREASYGVIHAAIADYGDLLEKLK
jgi:inorganic pyrophosphatase